MQIETYKNFNKTEPTLEVSKDYPLEAAVCNALLLAGYTLPLGFFKLGCESLADFIKTSDEVDKFYKSTAPILYGEYRAKAPGYFKPSEVISVLVHSVNLWLGEKDILSFEMLTSNEIEENYLNKSQPVLLIYRDDKVSSLIPVTYNNTTGKSYEAIDDKGSVVHLDKSLLKNFKPFDSDKKWVVTIRPAEPVI